MHSISKIASRNEDSAASLDNLELDRPSQTRHTSQTKHTSQTRHTSLTKHLSTRVCFTLVLDDMSTRHVNTTCHASVGTALEIVCTCRHTEVGAWW
mmetsp:Transcript_21238/g.31140  ORF Transcript_21238/g.31140 Transcript_21238/m.31140 type:complete len:96 (-) Transcript_21238:540-827(-)